MNDNDRPKAAAASAAFDSITLPRPIVLRSTTSCACHGPAWIVQCPRCRADAYSFASRPGIDRDPLQDRGGWVCSACGASGTSWRAAA